MMTETPLHMGTGTDLGIVDMPIQRERHTSFPKIEASGLKGSLRETFTERKLEKECIEDLFGPESSGDYAAALGFSDGRVLFYPVKSMKGVFAWITCEEVLYRFIKDMEMCLDGEDREKLNDIEIPKANTIIASDSNLIINETGRIILEEFLFVLEGMIEKEKATMNWIIELFFKYGKDDFQREKMKKDLVVLSGDDFKDFVNYSTEVITRTRINEMTGTVDADRGGLFTEEYLPVNTVLYSLALASPIFKKEEDKKDSILKGENELDEATNVLNYFTDHLPSIIQLGGNATLGKGLVRISTGRVVL